MSELPDTELKGPPPQDVGVGDYPAMVETFLLPLGPAARRGLRHRARA